MTGNMDSEFLLQLYVGFFRKATLTTSLSNRMKKKINSIQNFLTRYVHATLSNKTVPQK